jgi:hypothetical protein
MCFASKAPKITAPPPAPAVYMPTNAEMIDPASIAGRDRERRRQMAKYGHQSTILAGSGSAPTTSSKSLLGA